MEKIYEYGRIQKLAESLNHYQIAPELFEKIMAEGENIKESTNPYKKAEWLKDAMTRMDLYLDLPTRIRVREYCACCLGGKRLKASKDINKNYLTFDERIRIANETKLVFGHSVRFNEVDEVEVSFQPDSWESYKCSCIPQMTEKVSLTYCFCCGGHVKHHLQTVLGRALECTVVSSALNSEGKLPCVFRLKLVS